MKTRLLKWLAGAGIMLVAGICGAQTSVTLTSAGDSSWGGNCPTPANVYFYAYGTATNYATSDSIDIQYFFGDGTSFTEKVPIWSNAFYGWQNHTYTAAGVYSFMAIATGPDGKADTIIQTPGLYVADTCGNINGKIYLDNNTNCVYDAGVDSIINGYPITLSQGGTTIQWGWSDANGDYFFTAAPGVQYTLTLGNPGSSGYTITCPVSGVVTFTATSNSVNNFGLSCGSTGYDLQTQVSVNRFRPRFNGWVWVTAQNLSCNGVNAVLTVTLDPHTSYVSSWKTPTSVVGNVLTWNLNNLSYGFNHWWYYNSFSTYIQVLVDSTAQIGDTLCFTSSITPTAGDINISNNTSSDCGPVTNSYDPNMKEVSPIGTGSTGDVAPNTDFTYTIHFQNTGNDIAYNIAILDTIDSDLDVNTLQVLSSSHQMHTRLVTGNAVKFSFDNIMLPDSGTNMSGSMGYVSYKIKAKTGLANGTQIRNTAHIFFDYNEAIVTNTTLNTISIALGIENEKVQNTYHVYPNPANGELNLSFDKNFTGQLSLIDMLGKEVIVKAIDGQMNTVINTTDLNKGVYFIRINEQINTTQKVIIIH